MRLYVENAVIFCESQRLSRWNWIACEAGERQLIQFLGRSTCHVTPSVFNSAVWSRNDTCCYITEKRKFFWPLFIWLTLCILIIYLLVVYLLLWMYGLCVLGQCVQWIMCQVERNNIICNLIRDHSLVQCFALLQFKSNVQYNTQRLNTACCMRT